MTALERLQAIPIAGNAMDDAELFAMADRIIANRRLDFQTRIDALRVIDKAMGEVSSDLDTPAGAEQALATYMESREA